jgi:hypothetical protein
MSRGGHNWKGSGTVEGTRFIDVMKLARAGVLSVAEAGGRQWSYGHGTTAAIQIKGGKHEIILDYRVRDRSEGWQSVQQRAPIIWTPCRLGGERPWFVCNVSTNGVHCSRLVAKLYGAGRLFACRHCYRLGYAVQRRGPVDRAHHHLARLHRKLGSDYDGPFGPPPIKPKWMRRRTYDSVLQQIEAGVERLDIAFTAGAQRLLARLGRTEHGRRSRR